MPVRIMQELSCNASHRSSWALLHTLADVGSHSQAPAAGSFLSWWITGGQPTSVKNWLPSLLAGIMDQLAAELGFSYTVIAADIDEKALGAGAATPSVLVMLLARAKAAAIQGRLETHALSSPVDSASPATAPLAREMVESRPGSDASASTEQTQEPEPGAAATTEVQPAEASTRLCPMPVQSSLPALCTDRA